MTIPPQILSLALAAHRAAMAAALTLSAAVLWGEARRQSIQDVLHGIPLRAVIVVSMALIISSSLVFGFRRKLAIYGFAIAAGGFLVATLPTV